MKKLLNISLAILAIAAMVAVGCTSDDPLEPDYSDTTQEEEETGGEEGTEGTEGTEEGGTTETVVFTAALESLNKTEWTAGEEILIYDGTTKTVTTAAAGSSAELEGDIAADAEVYIAYYPAADGPTLSADGISTSVPVQQTAAESVESLIKLVGTSTSNRIALDDVYSYVAFTTSIENVDKITFTSDADIAGDLSIAFESGTPGITLTNPSKSIEVTGPFTVGQTYYFLAAPGTIGTLTANAVTSSEAEYEFEGLATDFTAGGTAQLADIYEPCLLKGVYQISHLWVYGGTGADYGGTGVRDLYEYSNYFVSSLGRGIEAEKDNYIEVLQDGTVYNWAGEDGKNSRFVFKAEYNKGNTGYPIELEKFYRKLPKGQSSVVTDDEGNVTFTDADGNTFSGYLLPAGDYENYTGSAGYSRVTTITTAAIKFDITGGTDDWTNNFTEYDKLAANPHALYIEVTPMESGFTVPEASKTVETIPEDEVLDPDEPDHTSFDITSLPGTWGFSDATTDLLVLGGCGSSAVDVSFVGPVAKSWDWNDSIYKIADDLVTISYESDGFYFTYSYGDDGLTWDCIWNSSTYADYYLKDLSDLYAQLPEGKHKVTFDTSTLVVTFDDGTQCQFLTPGTHKFGEVEKEATIPDNCWGIYFDFGAPSGGYEKNEYQYKDIDRFVLSPHGYLMIFHSKD